MAVAYLQVWLFRTAELPVPSVLIDVGAKLRVLRPAPRSPPCRGACAAACGPGARGAARHGPVPGSRLVLDRAHRGGAARGSRPCRLVRPEAADHRRGAGPCPAALPERTLTRRRGGVRPALDPFVTGEFCDLSHPALALQTLFRGRVPPWRPAQG
ncbi:hypothetical protein QJS66_11275 [Kocuria rhizophila]|nr:hypothetical protein QJS66_11275 [Kocuria rhizophila]